MRIHRCHVDDGEAAREIRIVQNCPHDDLATHGVAQEMNRAVPAGRPDRLGEGLGHGGVGEILCPGGTAMVR